MTFAIALATVLLVVAVAHLVVGWFVANAVHSEALVVRSRVEQHEVRVRAVSSDGIVLEAPAPRQDIGHPGILGLAWDGGYGRLSEVTDVTGSRVSRGFEQVSGTPPVCVGPLSACPAVEIDGFVFPGDPATVGLDFEEVRYRSPLGDIGAWLVPGGAGSDWAIHCHGWTADRREFLRMLPDFHETGFTSLVIDYRNDPDAPRDPTGRYRFGLTEWSDLEGAVRFALDHGATRIVLSGCSTGGAIVLSFLERSESTGQVVGILLDSPNIVLADTIRHAARDRRVTRLMFEVGLWIADLRWKVDWETTDYVTRAPSTLTMPTLVFHGTSDQTVPIAESRRLAALVRPVVELVETPAAGHVLSWNADPERYGRYLRSFLERL